MSETTKLLESVAANHPALAFDPLARDLVDELWARLDIQSPALWSALLSTYAWPAETQLDFVLLYPRAPGSVAAWEAAVTRDRALSEVLLARKLLPFGRPVDGSYDPICFDTTARRGRDCPIVRVDHESVLLKSTPRIVATLSRDTRSWLERLRPIR